MTFLDHLIDSIFTLTQYYYTFRTTLQPFALAGNTAFSS